MCASSGRRSRPTRSGRNTFSPRPASAIVYALPIEPGERAKRHSAPTLCGHFRIMKVSDFLSSADVSIAAAFADKPKLLEDLARRAAAVVDLEAAQILAELQKREE